MSIENIKVIYKNNKPQKFEGIRFEDMTNSFELTHKWKSPGIYEITNV